jgi:hypothetical protein
LRMLKNLQDLEPGQRDFEPRVAKILAFHDYPWLCPQAATRTPAV